MLDEARMHRLGVLDKQSLQDRDADAAADVAGQAEQGGALGQDRARQRRKTDRTQRHEHKAQPETLNQPRDDNRLHIHGEREPAHLIERQSSQREPAENEQTDIHQVDDAADQEHRGHGTDAARRDDKTGARHRVVHRLLQHWRQQRQSREHDDPDKEHQHDAGDEIAVAQQVAVEERGLARRYRMDDEQIEGEAGDRRRDPDLGRIEPILELAAVEQQLQRADGDAERCEPEKIEALAPGLTSLMNENKNAEEGNDADRQVDVEYP